MAVQAPDSHAAVVELYILMDKQIFPPLEIHGKILLRTVTRTARSDGLGQGLSTGPETPDWIHVPHLQVTAGSGPGIGQG